MLVLSHFEFGEGKEIHEGQQEIKLKKGEDLWIFPFQPLRT